MNDIKDYISAFTELGKFIGQFSKRTPRPNAEVAHNDIFFEGFKHQIKLAEEHNGWFTKDNLMYVFENWSNSLKNNNIEDWLLNYNFNYKKSKKVAIIMAGNIPLVGFHDFMSVLVSGHQVLVKQSSNDKHLLPYLAKYLEYVEPQLKGRISFTDGELKDFDAVIATGSNNTARYFEYYFKGKPSIIRKNRNSVALLTGKETEEDLKLLSEDIFRYYGLGCRSVSKLFVPQDYDFDAFFKAMYHWHPIIGEAKYANNYDYNKAVYLMSKFDMLENGFMMIKEDQSYASPIATVFYEAYNNLEDLKTKLIDDADKIQCIVAKDVLENEVPFGQTQKPRLNDYADGVDTIEFLLMI